MKLTASQQAEKRQQLARYTEEDLARMTTAALRELANGLVPYLARMPKKKLIAEILAATQAERVIAVMVPDTPMDAIATSQATVSEFREDVNDHLGKFAQKIYLEFRSIVQNSIQPDGSWSAGIYGDLASLATRIHSWLSRYEGKQNDGGLAYTTKLRYRTHIINLFTEQLNAEQGSLYFKSLESCLDYLKRQISIQFADFTQQKKDDYKVGLAERKEGKEKISFKPLHEFAVTVLSNLDSLKASQWKAVSVSLAIVTGKRMAEIHQSATSFKQVGLYSVEFTGQLKVKGSAEDFFLENPSYEIPTLIDAQLVCKAHKWLKDNGKVVDDSASADRRYSKDLSEFVKGLKQSLGINHDGFTYKGLRSIYAQACNQVFNQANPDNALYLARILGHGRGDLGRLGKLVDLLTPQSYNSDFEVVDTHSVLP